MRNISLSRSFWVSTVFGVNCACVAMNDDLGRDRDVRIGVEHDAGVGAEFDLAGLLGRQIDVHVDVRAVSSMAKTLPPAGSTSPILAMRYWMRPSRGATSVLSAIWTL